jgi:hypothetical protein
MHSAIRSCGLTAFLFVASILWPAVAGAITVDGQLDPAYTLMSTQTNQTNAGDDVQGLVTFSRGSELDGAYAAVEGGVLYLFFTGNLMDTIDPINPRTDYGLLNVFIDSEPGGQNPLTSYQPGITQQVYAGLVFDNGFAPDHWIQFAPGGALASSFMRSAWYEVLPAGGGGASYLLGAGTNGGAPGTLSGGTNPYGIEATIDNQNTAGVGYCCGTASGAGVMTGVEMAIPLAAIGNPTGCVRVNAFIDQFGITDQVLPPVAVGSCSQGTPSTLDFASVPGDQFFTVCLGLTPTRSSSWGSLKAVYR